MPYYHFRQNNSGGVFDYYANVGIAQSVYVEAPNAREANINAIMIGLYFDGQDDCSCCGNRWHEVDEDDAIDGAPEDHRGSGPVAQAFNKKGRYLAFVHPLNAKFYGLAKKS